MRELCDECADELVASRNEDRSRDATGAYPNTSEATVAINCIGEERSGTEQNVRAFDGYFIAAPLLGCGVETETLDPRPPTTD